MFIRYGSVLLLAALHVARILSEAVRLIQTKG